MRDGCRLRGEIPRVAEQLRIVAERQGVHFMDAVECEFNEVDFMHLTVRVTPGWQSCWAQRCPSWSEQKEVRAIPEGLRTFRDRIFM